MILGPWIDKLICAWRSCDPCARETAITDVLDEAAFETSGQAHDEPAAQALRIAAALLRALEAA